MSVIIILAVGAGSFYGGMVYAKKGKLQPAGGVNERFLQGGAMNGQKTSTRGRNMGGFVNGEVLTKDDTSITVKLRDGGSKIVFVSGATKVSKSIEGSQSDVFVGQQVTISGDENSDGSVSAQSIQIRSAQAGPQNRAQ